MTVLFLFITSLSYSQSDTTLKLLIVTAHPDDDAAFSGTVYQFTHLLKGKADLCLITNGEGGYKYSTLAEDIYGLELTDEEVGRKNLPEIRKKELIAGCKIVGIKDFYFLEQKDHKYTNNIPEVLDSIWDVPFVTQRLEEILTKNKYDYVLVLPPTKTTHAHHSSAGILALRVIGGMKLEDRPVILAGSDYEKSDSVVKVYSGLEGYPETNINPDAPIFSFDRTTPFGFNNALNFKIISNWVIAEHKSQGTMQLLMNRGDVETYSYFAINDPTKIEKTKNLFERLKAIQFKKKEYNLN